MDGFLSFLTDYTDQLLVGAAIVTIILIPVVGFTLHRAKKVPGEEPMRKETYLLSKRQQRKYESSLIADGVEDLLLKLFTEGKITEERYKLWHLRFGKGLRLADLLPQPIELTPAQKKKASQVRLASLKKAKVLPVPAPKEVKKPKNIVDSILNGV